MQRMRKRRSFARAAAFAVGAVLDAQTFIVDAANGPGTNFTDLPPAVAAVPDGAVLDVRAGTYSAFAIVGKGLSVVFASGASVNGVLTVSVSNTSAAQSVLLRRMQLGWGSLVNLSNCQGLVVLEDCTVQAGGGNGPILTISTCAQVEVTRSSFGDGSTFSGASLDHSNVVIRNSRICGGLPGLQSTNCSLQLIDTLVGSLPGFIPSTAVDLQGGDLRVIGGSLFDFAAYSVSGIGTARIDPSVVFASLGLGMGIAPTIQLTNPTMPAVVATDGPLGGSFTVDLRGPAGDFGALLAGLPGPPLSFPGIADPSWMLPGTEVVCATTILAAGAHLVISVPVPNLAALRGLRVVWQGASFGAVNGLQASNPAITTHW
jgi:hypothetical protein